MIKNMAQTTDLAEKVLNHMLAPAQVRTSSNTDFVRLTSSNEMELRILWNIQPQFTTPGMFVHELERMLRPISEAITYGEVVDLRRRVETMEKLMADKDRRIADLSRYKDAAELLGGFK